MPLKSKPLLVAFDNKPFEVLSIDTIELYASKINALLDRATPRDLFDVNMMINKNIIDNQNHVYIRVENPNRMDDLYQR